MKPTQPSNNTSRRDARPSWITVTKYLIGESSPAETRDIEGWVTDRGDRQTNLTTLRAWWTAQPAEADPEQLDGILHNVLDRVQVQSPNASTVRRDSIKGRILSFGKHGHPQLSRAVGIRQRMMSWRTAGIAASLVLTCVVAVQLIGFAHEPAIDGGVTTYVTPPGGRAKIMLSDGTTVTLNVASRIEIPKQFDEHHRMVRLQGEADFQVARTTGSPFVVTAGHTQLRVLGTEFSVRAYRPTRVRVAVRTGKVAADTLVLGAHDVAQMIPSGQMTVQRNQNVDAAFAFVHGRLVLSNSALRNVIDDLDRWYDVDIRIEDAAVGDMPIDAVLMSGSIGDLIGFMQDVYDARVVRDGRTLTLYQR